MANGTNPAATAAAEPPEEPPGTRSLSHGFFTAPKNCFHSMNPWQIRPYWFYQLEWIPD